MGNKKYIWNTGVYAIAAFCKGISLYYVYSHTKKAI